MERDTENAVRSRVVRVRPVRGLSAVEPVVQQLGLVAPHEGLHADVDVVLPTVALHITNYSQSDTVHTDGHTDGHTDI